MLAVVESSAILGVEAYGVRVEINMTQAAIPQFQIVGLPDAAVQESKERVRAAIKNCGFLFPYDKRITVNLAPADTRKAGPAFDLPIAVAIMVASGQIAEEAAAGCALVGELGLDGSVRPVTGVLPMAIWAKNSHHTRFIVPASNTKEAAIVGEMDVYPVQTLTDVVLLLAGMPDAPKPVRADPRDLLSEDLHADMDFADVKTSEVPLLCQNAPIFSRNTMWKQVALIP